MPLEAIKSTISEHLDSTPEGRIPLILIIGPTAVGKTELSIGIAKAFDGEVISADSRQVYKGMDIGTDKITLEEMDGVPHHMLDMVEPDEEFTVYDFKKECNRLIPEISARGHMPFIVGGTMLYSDAVVKNFDFAGVKPNPEIRKELEGILEREGKEFLYKKLQELDPEAAKNIHPNNTYYVMRAIEKILNKDAKNPEPKPHNYHVLKIGLIRPREELYSRINTRVEQQLKDGKLEAEAKEMIEKYGENERSITGLGYRQFIPYFNGDTKLDGTSYTLEDVKSHLQKETRNFAKRQLSWWRKDKDIHWFEVG
ncbi:tRNA (adenosine(37)-N6)-dimethylallyltransferase MiaA [Candidatus Peregrinibacteria bacterium]|jgi:tRNA dimethylallyltransferase|nr:tRNA (adenosine(37)-N6)-dimethylallyltransferase MiaA [Candidatus Peregrinibacteria bacterium]